MTVEQQVKNEIAQHFDRMVDIENRLYVVSDLYKFRWKDDESVWGQKRGKTEKYYEITFDNEHVCGFDESETMAQVMVKFWKGMRDGYKEGKIRLNKFLAEEERKRELEKVKNQKKDRIKRIKNIKASTPEQKIAKEVVERLNANPKKGSSSTPAKRKPK